MPDGDKPFSQVLAESRAVTARLKRVCDALNRECERSAELRERSLGSWPDGRQTYPDAARWVVKSDWRSDE
jgi:hypothetical protein